MQLTNGAIKAGAKPPPMSAKPAEAAKGKEPLDLDTLDLSDFAVAVFERKGANLRPSQKDAAVTGFLAETTELHKLGVTYETEFLARGHQALYELLASMYSLALRIESSAHAGLVVEAIRKDLKEAHGLTIQSNSTPMAAVVRYVVRSDKAAASRYTKVLQVAREEDLSATELPDYITRRGGISAVQDTESKALAKKTGDKSSKERTALIREFFELSGISSKEDFKFTGTVVVHNDEKKTAAEASSFCVFVAHHVGGDDYKMIMANDLGKAYEDNLIKYLGREMPSDLHTIERGARNFKRKLSMGESQPISLREAMQRQLKEPLKHQQVEVIEVEAVVGDGKS